MERKKRERERDKKKLKSYLLLLAAAVAVYECVSWNKRRLGFFHEKREELEETRRRRKNPLKNPLDDLSIFMIHLDILREREKIYLFLL